MERLQKLALIQRSLGLRHKIKVHESIKAPDSHEELSIMLLSKWELEDELRAIESLLNDARDKNVGTKRSGLLKAGIIPPDLPIDAVTGKKKRSTK